MFIRFVIERVDEQSGRRLGVFQALFELEDAGQLRDYEAAQLRETVAWFDEHLATPTRLRRSGKYHASNRAISWFRDAATAHIRRMRELASILEEHGVPVQVLRSDKPGYVVYEDAFQVVAEPFSDSGA